MSEHVRMSDDPKTPNQRLVIKDEIDEWDMVSIRDEDTTSASTKAATLRKMTVTLTTSEARWVRDVLNRLDLGDAQEPA